VQIFPSERWEAESGKREERSRQRGFSEKQGESEKESERARRESVEGKKEYERVGREVKGQRGNLLQDVRHFAKWERLGAYFLCSSDC